MRQRCWRHLLAETKKPAVLNGGDDKKRHDMMLALYHKTKEIKTLAPMTVTGLKREAYGIASGFGKKLRMLIVNAIPNMFIFLSVLGMPPHNNPAEGEMRVGVVPQRNARHKTVTAEGRNTLGSMITFTRTCRKQNVSPGSAVL